MPQDTLTGANMLTILFITFRGGYPLVNRRVVVRRQHYK